MEEKTNDNIKFKRYKIYKNISKYIPFVIIAMGIIFILGFCLEEIGVMLKSSYGLEDKFGFWAPSVSYSAEYFIGEFIVLLTRVFTPILIIVGLVVNLIRIYMLKEFTDPIGKKAEIKVIGLSFGLYVISTIFIITILNIVPGEFFHYVDYYQNEDFYSKFFELLIESK